jgi:Xaa-Pro aminopeptidase
MMLLHSPSCLLRQVSAKAILFTNPVSIRYLTGFSCSEGALLLTPRRMMLLVDDRYREAALEQSGEHLQVHPRTHLRKLLERMRECAIESEYVTIHELSELKAKYKNIKFVYMSEILHQARRRKSAQELRALRRADRMTGQLLQRIPSVLRPGLREREVAGRLHLWANEAGADDLSFPPIVAFGSHTSRPHHQPGSRKLRARDSVLVDCGVRVAGYCGDRTQMFFLGEPTSLQKRALSAVREALIAAKELVRPGMSVHALDRAARDVLCRYGMEDAFTHALGHGIGLEVHEGVTLSQRGPDCRLLPHEVITIEPGVYFPGRFGIRLEEMVVVPAR